MFACIGHAPGEEFITKVYSKGVTQYKVAPTYSGTDAIAAVALFTPEAGSRLMVVDCIISYNLSPILLLSQYI